jgi:hypothetical protein
LCCARPACCCVLHAARNLHKTRQRAATVIVLTGLIALCVASCNAFGPCSVLVSFLFCCNEDEALLRRVGRCHRHIMPDPSQIRQRQDSLGRWQLSRQLSRQNRSLVCRVFLPTNIPESEACNPKQDLKRLLSRLTATASAAY